VNSNLNATVDVVVDHAFALGPDISASVATNRYDPRDADIRVPFGAAEVNLNVNGGVHVHVHVNV
jgi:hypothetical protein